MSIGNNLHRLRTISEIKKICCLKTMAGVHPEGLPPVQKFDSYSDVFIYFKCTPTVTGRINRS